MTQLLVVLAEELLLGMLAIVVIEVVVAELNPLEVLEDL